MLKLAQYFKLLEFSRILISFGGSLRSPPWLYDIARGIVTVELELFCGDEEDDERPRNSSSIDLIHLFHCQASFFTQKWMENDLWLGRRWLT